MFDKDGNHLGTLRGEAGRSKWRKLNLDANPEMYKERDVAAAWRG
jgi:hypothetical protein